MKIRTGGRILVDALRLHGTDRVFCVPGESYLDVLDALYDTPEIKLIVAKHEGAAAIMAEADGKLIGRPGICFVTRGPGATHASAGVHIAFQDSTPMILFIGQVEREHLGREAFQEVDFRQMFAPLAKWSTEIEHVEDIPAVMLQAFEYATSGRPGPVVISLPEDMLGDVAEIADTACYRSYCAQPTALHMEALAEELARAEKPLMIVGGSCWTAEACLQVRQFAEANHLPVAASFRRQDLFDNNHACYAGHLGFGLSPQLAKRFGEADLLLVIGARLGDVTTRGYTLLTKEHDGQRLVHVHASENELGRVFTPDVAIHSASTLFAAELAEVRPIAKPSWKSWTERAHAEFVSFTTPRAEAPEVGVDLSVVVAYLAERLPCSASISNGAGNYTAWVHRFFRYKQPATELAPTNGAMGYGLPAAIAAKLRSPENISVCFAGDGCFLMYPQELATASQYGANIIVIVVNNGIYGTIRMHQEMRFPGRVSGTDLVDPDFVALGKSFGAYAERIDKTEEFADAFERAVAAGKPALLELRTDWRQSTPDKRLV